MAKDESDKLKESLLRIAARLSDDGMSGSAKVVQDGIRQLDGLRRQLAQSQQQEYEKDVLIGEWQEASGLADSGGDPQSITPEHLANRIREDENRIRELDAKGKTHEES